MVIETSRPIAQVAKDLDLVSRKWLTHVVSAEETHTQVRLGFEQALDGEGLLDAALERADALDARLDPGLDDGLSPILLAVSDNGSQMIAGNTRAFMAMVAIAQHFGRPSTPTDQAWIESLNKTIKYDYPHLMAITDPAVLRAELDVVQADYNTNRLHSSIGYVTPDDEHTGRGKRSGKPVVRDSRKPANSGWLTIGTTARINPTQKARMWSDPKPQVRQRR